MEGGEPPWRLTHPVSVGLRTQVPLPSGVHQTASQREHDGMTEGGAMDDEESQFAELFEVATGFDPYPYQVEWATASEAPDLVHVPTGAGKTAAAILA